MVMATVEDDMLAVIGCGDPNRQDDGFGSAVITRLIELTAAQYDRRAKLLDAGLDGMGVLFYAKGAKAQNVKKA